jgi:hypothetical protein
MLTIPEIKPKLNSHVLWMKHQTMNLSVWEIYTFSMQLVLTIVQNVQVQRILIARVYIIKYSIECANNWVL